MRYRVVCLLQYSKLHKLGDIFRCMNDRQLDDLKQFLDARFLQSEQSIKSELRQEVGRIEQEIEQLRQEMRDGFSGVGDAIEGIHARIDALEHHTV